MRTVCIAFLALAPAAALVAQSAPSGPNQDTVVLESFVVNTDKDAGYIAVDSLAGGRTATPIKLTPTAISSLTRAFLDDVAITDVREALKWSVNVIPSDLNAGKSSSPFNDWDFNFRGAGQSLQGGSGPTRNYFTFYQSADTYNIERLEFDRGPNSILFGVGTIGGAIIGGLIIGVLNNGMSIMGIGIEWQQAVKGLVLLLAVAFDVYNKRRSGNS